MNVHGFSEVRHTEMHTFVPLMPETECFETEMSIQTLKR